MTGSTESIRSPVSQTVSALLGGGYVHSPEAMVDETLAGKEAHLDLLGNLGKAVATGAEAEEDLLTITAGSVGLKVSFVNSSSVCYRPVLQCRCPAVSVT